MKILLDIPDSRVPFFMEVLKNFKFVKKAVPLTDAKAEIMSDIREAVEELKMVKAGKLVARDADELLNEL